jgi:hypothetical protein
MIASLAEAIAAALPSIATVRTIVGQISGDAHDSVGFARARSTLYATTADQLTAHDASQAVLASLLAGELDDALAIRPVASHRDDRAWRLHAYLAELVRAPLGAPDIAVVGHAVCELHAALDEDDAESLLALADITEAYARARAGEHGAAIKRYARYQDDPQLRPWHALALGDALAATGDIRGARELWTRVAHKRAWDPYWPDLAGERLGRDLGPYR